MRRKSNEEKKMNGTFRSDRASKEVKLDVAIPECPITLSEDAKKIWDSLSLKLLDMKVLTGLDGYTLSLFCETFTRWNYLRGFLVENGDSYTAGNLIKVRPEVGALKECLQSLDVLTKKLCLSPQDRQWLSIVPTEEELDPLEEFLRTGKANPDLKSK